MASRYNLRSRDTVEAEPEIQEKEPKKRRKSVIEEEDGHDVSTSSPEESSSSSSRHRQAKENGQKKPRYVLIDPKYENQERADRSDEGEDDGSEETTSLDGFIVSDIKPKSRLRKWVNPDITSTHDEEAEDESYELGSVATDVEMEPGEVEEEGEEGEEEGEEKGKGKGKMMKERSHISHWRRIHLSIS